MFRIVRTTKIVDNTNQLELYIPDTELKHGDIIRVCFAQTPPDGVDPAAHVTIFNDGKGFSVFHTRSCKASGALTYLDVAHLAHTPCGRIKGRQFIDVVYSDDKFTCFMYVGPCGAFHNT